MHSVYLWNKQSLWSCSLEIVTSVAPVSSTFYSISTMHFLCDFLSSRDTVFSVMINYGVHCPLELVLVENDTEILSSRHVYNWVNWTHMLLKSTPHLNHNVTPLNGWLGNVLLEKQTYRIICGRYFFYWLLPTFWHTQVGWSAAKKPGIKWEKAYRELTRGLYHIYPCCLLSVYCHPHFFTFTDIHI